jgi:hypothetical protein
LIQGFLPAMTALKLVLLWGGGNMVHAFGGASEQQGMGIRAGFRILWLWFLGGIRRGGITIWNHLKPLIRIIRVEIEQIHHAILIAVTIGIFQNEGPRRIACEESLIGLDGLACLGNLLIGAIARGQASGQWTGEACVAG